MTSPTLETHEDAFNDSGMLFLMVTTSERCDVQFGLPHYSSTTTCGTIFIVAFV